MPLRAMTSSYTKEGVRKADTVDTETVVSPSTRHEFSIKFNTVRRQKDASALHAAVLGDRAKRRTKKEIEGREKGMARIRDGENADYTVAADIILGSSTLEHY